MFDGIILNIYWICIMSFIYILFDSETYCFLIVYDNLNLNLAL